VNLVVTLLLYITTGNYLQAVQTKYLIETIHTKVKM
jgi:membrane protein insertase Oxa1/YidC/SpoIIIJ